MTRIRTAPGKALAVSLLMAGTATFGACEKNQGDKPKPVATPTAPVTKPMSTGGDGSPSATCDTVTSGLSAQDEQAFFHISEGSELLPLFLLERLKQSGDRPFLDNPGRFGLLPDEKDERRLPIGMSRNRPKDVKAFGVDFVGFNCAACHVGQVTVGSCQQRILGAPSRFDIRGFFKEFGDSFKPVNNFKGYLKIFGWYVAAVIAENKGDDARRVDLTKEAELARFAEGGSPAAKEVEAQFLRVFEAELPAGTLDPQLKRLELPPKLEPKAALKDELKDEALLPTVRTLDPKQRKQALRATLTDFYNLVQLLKARIAFVGKVTKDSAGGTLAGPGRIDAFMTALNLIYDAKLPTTSPVSYPRIWGVAKLPLFHWDDNTTSILDRNIGQAIGLGAVFTGNTSTLEPRGIDQLETHAEHFSSPKWPFGAPNEQQKKDGEKVYLERCAKCHTPDQNGHMPRQPTLDELGTDRHRVENMQAKVKGNPAIITLGGKLGELKRQAFKDHGIPEKEQKDMERHREVIFTVTDRYSARSLEGTWATAPYLHNNSVPTLAHLIGLKPRPNRFSWVSGDFDVKDVGLPFKEDPQGEFDTTQAGNANGGHEYTTGLSEKQKLDLLEFLKTL